MSRIAVAAALLVIGWSASTSVAHAEPDPSPTPSPHGGGGAPGPAQPGAEAAPPPGPLTSFGDGTYQVGTQILPGVYQSAGPVEGGVCYWKRTNGQGTLANAMSKQPQTVQIQAGDTTFKTSQCQDWQKTDAPPPARPNPGEVLGSLGSLIGGGAAPAGG
ncbi:hypothetical protein [Mycobacterium sp. 1274761.0]|uniref:hypothetical protein n=1 Tax=Mycobacterium sp. 1274761.0 TaxID=1834077 RepID=UPI0007FBDACE|nr:hypothetical protein [Mycobacterium sp. 1274761.0]OBK78738.1 hypothetical protein A5651_02095 [Mycobacterium sp. 1274761.0]